MKKIFSLLITLAISLSGCSGQTGWKIIQQDDLGTKYQGEATISGQLVEKELFGETRILFEVSEESIKDLPKTLTQTQFNLQDNIQKPHEDIGKEMVININQISIMTEGSPSLGLTDNLN